MALSKLLSLRSTPPTKPLLCLEVNPPRGTEIEGVYNRLEGKLEGIDFFNVTDSALARMRLAALPFAASLKQRFGIEPVVNISCRDRNLIAMQGDLLAAWMQGVRSVVALTGDAVSIGDMPNAKGVFEVNSVGLLNVIATLNRGTDLANNELKGKTDFCPGVVVNPNARNPAAEIKRLRKKKEAGAVYALSQPVFDLEAAREFLSAAKEVGVPIFLGLLAFKKASAARSVAQHVPGIRISPQVEEAIEGRANDDLSEFFLQYCLEIAAGTRELVCGFHVVSGTTPQLGIKLAQRLATYISSLDSSVT